MDFVRTAVFCTEEEAVEILRALDEPVIMTHILPMANPITFIHSIALKHGLPEIEGFYGIDMRAREFIRAKEFITA